MIDSFVVILVHKDGVQIITITMTHFTENKLDYNIYIDIPYTHI